MDFHSFIAGVMVGLIAGIIAMVLAKYYQLRRNE